VRTAIKQRSLGLREGLFTGLTAVPLHSFVCFAIFDAIAFSYLCIVGTGFVPTERPSLGRFLLFHGLVLPLFSPFFLHSLTPVKRETTLNVMRGKYHEATFQEKRNALEVLGVKVYIHPSAETPSREPIVTDQEWLSIPEASRLTGISQSSLFYHIRHETLTAHNRNVPMTVIHRDELAGYLRLKRPHVSLDQYDDEWFSINKIREAKIANYRPLHRAIRRGEITTQTRDVPHPCIHRDELNRFLRESPVRPKDTIEDIQPRIEITYTPMFTGVQSSLG
jgi:hypothetical protein